MNQPKLMPLRFVKPVLKEITLVFMREITSLFEWSENERDYTPYWERIVISTVIRSIVKTDAEKTLCNCNLIAIVCNCNVIVYL